MAVPAEEWLETLPQHTQAKFAALFAWMGDQGRIFNERKFKHLKGPKTPKGEIARAEALKHEFESRGGK